MNKSRLYKKNIYTQKPSHSKILVVLLIIFGFVVAQGAIAEVKTTVLFQPPPEDEQPDSTEGAASRQAGKCGTTYLESQAAISDRPNLTTVVPQSNHGLTVAQRPQFWVYIPQTTASQAFLSIRKEDNTPHWQQSVDLAGEAGIMGIELAEEAPALEVGNNYQWAIILVCGDRPSPNDPVALSWIKRVEAPQSTVNESTQGLEQAAAYAKQGIWYDALDILIAEKSSSTNWEDVWAEYLQSGGLESIANEPIISN